MKISDQGDYIRIEHSACQDGVDPKKMDNFVRDLLTACSIFSKTTEGADWRDELDALISAYTTACLYYQVEPKEFRKLFRVTAKNYDSGYEAFQKISAAAEKTDEGETVQ